MSKINKANKLMERIRNQKVKKVLTRGTKCSVALPMGQLRGTDMSQYK